MSEFRSVVTIQNVVARIFGVAVHDLRGASRARRDAVPRHVAMLIAKERTPRSTTEIGRMFGGRDHSTVLMGVDKIRHTISRDADVREKYEAACAALDALAIAPHVELAGDSLHQVMAAITASLVRRAERDPAAVMRLLAAAAGKPVEIIDAAIGPPRPARDVPVGQSWAFSDHRSLKEVT